MSDRYIFAQSSLAPVMLLGAEEENLLLKRRLSYLSDELELCQKKLRKTEQKNTELLVENAALLTENKILSCKYTTEQQRRLAAESASLRCKSMESELEKLKSAYASVMTELKMETEEFKKFHANVNNECEVIVQQLAESQSRLQEEEDKCRSLEVQVFGLKDLLVLSEARCDVSVRKIERLAQVESENASLKRKLSLVSGSAREMKMTCKHVAIVTRDAIDVLGPEASRKKEETGKRNLRTSLMRLIIPKARSRKVHMFAKFLNFTEENVSKLQKAAEDIEKALL